MSSAWSVLTCSDLARSYRRAVLAAKRRWNVEATISGFTSAARMGKKVSRVSGVGVKAPHHRMMHSIDVQNSGSFPDSSFARSSSVLVTSSYSSARSCV